MKELMMELKQELTYNVVDEILTNFYKNSNLENFNNYVNTIVMATKLGYYEFDEDIEIGDMATIVEMESMIK